MKPSDAREIEDAKRIVRCGRFDHLLRVGERKSGRGKRPYPRMLCLAKGMGCESLELETKVKALELRVALLEERLKEPLPQVKAWPSARDWPVVLRAASVVASAYGVEVRDLFMTSERRSTGEIVFIRNVVLFVLDKVVGLTQWNLSKAFGFKSHRNIPFAVKAIQKAMKEDERVKGEMEALVEKLLEP